MSPNGLVIRPWIASDQGSITNLMMAFATHDERTAAIHGAWQDALDPVYRTLVAWDEQGLRGVGTLWEHPLHPARRRVTLHGSPRFWSHGGAAFMLDHLRALRPDPRPLQTATSTSDVVQGDFWRRQGFSLLMRTRRGVVNPGVMAEPFRQEIATATQCVMAADYHLASLAELGDSSQIGQQLTHLHMAVYAQGHEWNPVRALTDEEAHDLFLDPEEVIPDAMVVALQGEDLVAVSSLRGTADVAQVDLGWTGVLQGHTAHGEDLIRAVVARCLHHVARANWRVLVEVDEADGTLWQLIENCSLELEPDWLTFAEH